MPSHLLAIPPLPHRQLNAEELQKAGVSEDMIRLSIGIEHIDDIKADLEQALVSSQLIALHINKRFT